MSQQPSCSSPAELCTSRYFKVRDMIGAAALALVSSPGVVSDRGKTTWSALRAASQTPKAGTQGGPIEAQVIANKRQHGRHCAAMTALWRCAAVMRSTLPSVLKLRCPGLLHSGTACFCAMQSCKATAIDRLLLRHRTPSPRYVYAAVLHQMPLACGLKVSQLASQTNATHLFA